MDQFGEMSENIRKELLNDDIKKCPDVIILKGLLSEQEVKSLIKSKQQFSNYKKFSGRYLHISNSKKLMTGTSIYAHIFLN